MQEKGYFCGPFRKCDRRSLHDSFFIVTYAPPPPIPTHRHHAQQQQHQWRRARE